MTLDELRGRVADVIAGQPCVVVGSAPLAPDVNWSGSLIAVNGGISSCPRAPDIWLLNARVQMGNARLHRLMWKQGKGYDVTLVVLLVREPEAAALMLKQLDAQGTKVRDHADVEHIDRMAIESYAGGRVPTMSKHALSAGLTAVCMAFWAGAESVRLAGISWTAGYAYTDEAIGNRGHTKADQLALSLLVQRYGARVQHALDLPVSMVEESMSVRNRPRTRGIAPSAPATFTPTAAGPVSLRVRATQTIFYNLRRYRAGDVLALRAPGDFKKSCMEHVSDDTPLRETTPVQAQRQAHREILTGRAPTLQPNAADLAEVVPLAGDPANVSPIEA